MKKAKIIKLNIIFIVLFCLFPSLAKADSIYDGIKDYCYDELSIIDDETKENIKKTNLELESKTGSQIVVATLNNPDGLEGMDYGSEIFNKLEIGDKQKDNGILILFLENKNTGQREISIIPGYGLEGKLNDAKVGRIIDDFMLEYFKQGDYSKGINEGFNAVVGQVIDEYGIELTGDYAYYQDKVNEDNGLTFTDIIIMLFIFIIFSRLLSRLFIRPSSYYRGRGRRNYNYPYWTGGSFGSDDDDSWSGWSSGGGFSGGGGSTGGGGASRKF